MFQDQQTAEITGQVKWAANALRNGSLAIALLLDDEQAPADIQGRKPLRGINLQKDLSVRVFEALGNTLFIGDTITVTVFTNDLSTDMAAGKGLSGGPGYFVGSKVAL